MEGYSGRGRIRDMAAQTKMLVVDEADQVLGNASMAEDVGIVLKALASRRVTVLVGATSNEELECAVEGFSSRGNVVHRVVVGDGQASAVSVESLPKLLLME